MLKEIKTYSRRDVLKMFAGVVGGAALPESSNNSPPIHTVEPGETLFLIARKYGLTLDQIVQANPQVVDINRIEIGQLIVISGSSQRPAIQSEVKETELQKPIFWGDRAKPEVALTFDDGFNKDLIGSVLDTLKSNGLKCTFFILGPQLSAFPNLWERAVEEGHQVCNHTCSHSHLTDLSVKEITREIERWEHYTEDVLGADYLRQMKDKFSFIRFPGGAGHKSPGILKLVAQLGYLPIGWSAETYNAVLSKHDYKNEPVDPIAQEIHDHIVSGTQNGSIVLLHFNIWDVSRFDQIIDGLDTKKLKPKPVSEIID